MTAQTTEKKQRPARRTLNGVIVSLSSPKTAVVEIEETKQHPKYKKSYLKTKRFHAQVGEMELTMGQAVKIIEARPTSAHKRWRIIKA